ncbi:MAG: SRPBCC domain-containing protein [Phycisphaeraceae bacterium]|nr:SRPBCC domain-containing protein [Phycisphaeraceae bacterium]
MVSPNARTDERRQLKLRIKRRFKAPRQLVWDAWTRTEHLTKWFRPKDFTVHDTLMDLQPGGRWRSEMRSPENRLYVHYGVVREVSPIDRFVFTHAWEDHQNPEPCQTGFESVVTIELKECDGFTEMLFEQVGFESGESRDSHEGGWTEAFDNLAEHVESSDATGGHEIVISRVFHAPRKLVWSACTEADHIARWWGPRGFATRVDELDFRVGGRWRYIMIGPDGKEYPGSGVFTKIVPHEMFAHTDEFDEGFELAGGGDLPDSMVSTTTFEDVGESTKVTIRISHASEKDRQSHEDMGVVEGFASTLDCLAEHLATHQGQSATKDSPTIILPDQRRLVVIKSYEAPPPLIFDAHTKPEYLKRWFSGDDQWPMVECRLDPRVGGEVRFVWRHQDGRRMGLGGEMREFDPPHAFAHTERFDDDWPGGEMLTRYTFQEHHTGTMVNCTVQFHTAQARKAAIDANMLDGWNRCIERLERLLAEPSKQPD